MEVLYLSLIHILIGIESCRFNITGQNLLSFYNPYPDNFIDPMTTYGNLSLIHISYFKGEEWRTQKETQRLIDKYFTTKPDGIPGNDDTGTMSSWAIFNMIGFYPDCPGLPEYTLTTPVFNKVTIRLDPKWYKAVSYTHLNIFSIIFRKAGFLLNMIKRLEKEIY